VTSRLDSQQPDALFVIDLERIIPSEAKGQTGLRSLNASRDLWEQRFRCPVVLWLPEYAAALLSIHARDLWRYRSHRFEFVFHNATEAGGTAGHFSDFSAASNLSQEEKQFRIAELQQRLADVGEPPGPELAAHSLLWLNELAFLYYELGRLDDAEDYWRKLSERASASDSQAALASAYGGLGNILLTRGDLDGAERMYRKVLAINEKLGQLEGMAHNYSNLGILLQTRGDLSGAELMYQEALAINEKLGRLEGMAHNYGNLGTVLQARGDLGGAEAMHRQALAIDEKLGQLEGMASTYGNLGILLTTRGDLGGAEMMYRKALAIDEKLGRLEGVATDYGNLGGVLRARGDLGAAREMWTKSRELFARIGASHMVEGIQGWIDSLPG
jgi:tetratricopeptide (TPR) repeat protein